MTAFLMPSLGADMEVGVIVEWLVGPGDEVKRGDVVALVETEKGIIDVEIWRDATVESIVVPVGQEVPVGAVIATVTPTGSDPAAARREVSPRARSVARQLGVDPSSMAGSGRINEAAVRSETPGSDPMRRAIARAMTRSKREIPHYYLAADIDVTSAIEWMRRANADSPLEARLVPAAILARATALAAAQVPEMNGHYDGAGFIPSRAVHLGLAISQRGGGLVAPAIRDCDSKALSDVMAELADLVRRARRGRLRDSELDCATITATMLGERGVDRGYGVIIPPQVALVCFGKIGPRPAVVDGAVVVREFVTASLSGDHRVADGHRGGEFLNTIDRYLQTPEEL